MRNPKVKGWDYIGDLNLEYGGIFFRTEDVHKWMKDHTSLVRCIEVVDAESACGLENTWLITAREMSPSEEELGKLDWDDWERYVDDPFWLAVNQLYDAACYGYGYSPFNGWVSSDKPDAKMFYFDAEPDRSDGRRRSLLGWVKFCMEEVML
jgi:hypothetical protein